MWDGKINIYYANILMYYPCLSKLFALIMCALLLSSCVYKWEEFMKLDCLKPKIDNF